MTVTVHEVTREAIDEQVVARWQKVPVAIAVDQRPRPGQIDAGLRPLLPPGQQARLFGRAVTARCEPPDFGAVLHALDVLVPGDVLVIAAGGHHETAMIGEILTAHLRRRGGAGLVVDGAVRDVATLAGWPDIPVFARHVNPFGPTGFDAGEVNAAVAIGGCVVAPGDLIIGDDDGLVAISPESAAATIAACEAKMATEAAWIAALDGGATTRETFGLAAPAVRRPGRTR
jgi:regulator of RNase E activity RraA